MKGNLLKNPENEYIKWSLSFNIDKFLEKFPLVSLENTDYYDGRFRSQD